jgi:3-methyladenine DNA glycosylase Mpg
MSHSGLLLTEVPFEFQLPQTIDASSILSGRRIGISKAVEAEWAVWDAGLAVSKSKVLIGRFSIANVDRTKSRPPR